MGEADFIETRAFLEDWGEQTLQEMKSRLLAAGKDATGGLLKSLNYKITWDGSSLDIEFGMAEYGEYVERGRRPGGKQPPLSAITPWLRIKGIPQQYAFPIARKIAKEGIRPTPFFESVIDSRTQLFSQGYAQAYAQDLSNWLAKQINNTNTP